MGKLRAALVASNCSVTIKRRPEVSITTPANNIVLNVGAPIVLTAGAFDLDGSVTPPVVFYSYTNGGVTNVLGNGIQLSLYAEALGALGKASRASDASEVTLAGLRSAYTEIMKDIA